MRLLLRLLLPYSWRVAMAVGLGAAVVVSNMGLLAAAAYLIAAASVAHLMAPLIIPMYAVRLLSATRGGARYAERLVSHRITFDVLARLRVRLYDRFRALGPAGLVPLRSGDALARVVSDVEDLQNAYLLFAAPIAVAVVVSALLFLVLLALGRTIALTTLLFLVLSGVAVPLLAAALTRTAGPMLVNARGTLNDHLVQSIQGSRDILSNGADRRYGERTAALARQIARAEGRLAAVRAGREGALELLSNAAVLCALGLTISLVARGAVPGLYVAVPALVVLAGFEAVRPLGAAAETASTVRAAGRRVLSIGADLPPEPVAVSAMREPHPTGPYSVAFQNVTFGYGGQDGPALHRVSFEVPEGSRVAVVGPSGAGKTTLVRLLTRMWEGAEGRILIGGRDISTYSLPALRAMVSVVAQDTYIFNTTVRNNLLLARPNAPTEELEAVLTAVELLDLVRSLPRGLDTWAGEWGGQFSGGERQRLSVARMLLQDAPIVLLDEVTANLDPISERALLDTIDRATEGRTLLMITHRLVGLERMDAIVVLDGGRVAECGPPAQLYTRGGLYRRLIDVQEDMLAV